MDVIALFFIVFFVFTIYFVIPVCAVGSFILAAVHWRRPSMTRPSPALMLVVGFVLGIVSYLVWAERLLLWPFH